MHIRLTPQTIAAAHVMRAKGMSLDSIARRLSVARATIRGALLGHTHKARAAEIREHLERGKT